MCCKPSEESVSREERVISCVKYCQQVGLRIDYGFGNMEVIGGLDELVHWSGRMKGEQVEKARTEALLRY